MRNVKQDAPGSTGGDCFGWALDQENSPVHVTDVKKGIKCGCHCPVCDGILIAKQGKIKIWHFAHHDSRIDCPVAAETALHLAAKEIVKDLNGGILLPKETIRKKGWPESPEEGKYDYRSDCRKNLDNKMIYEREEKHLLPDWSVELEVTDWLKSDGFKPDTVLTKDKHKLLVEIRVTHAVDSEKRKQLRKSGFGAIEIDLQKTDRNISRLDLEKLIKKDASRKWLSTARPKLHKTKESQFTEILQKEADNLNRMKLREFSKNGNINACPRRNELNYNSGNPYECMKCEYHNGISDDFYPTPLYELLSDEIKSKDKSVVFCSHKNTCLGLSTERQKHFVQILAQEDLKNFNSSLDDYLTEEWRQNFDFCNEFINVHNKCRKCGTGMILRRNKKNNNVFWGCPQFSLTGCKGSSDFIPPIIRKILESIPERCMS